MITHGKIQGSTIFPESLQPARLRYLQRPLLPSRTWGGLPAVVGIKGSTKDGVIAYPLGGLGNAEASITLKFGIPRTLNICRTKHHRFPTQRPLQSTSDGTYVIQNKLEPNFLNDTDSAPTPYEKNFKPLIGGQPAGTILYTAVIAILNRGLSVSGCPHCQVASPKWIQSVRGYPGDQSRGDLTWDR